MSREARANEAFAGLTGALVGPDYDPVDYLHRLTEACVALGEVSGAGIVVADPRGRLRDVAYSSERVRALESLQVSLEEGPCLDCYRTGEPVVEPDLDGARERWPRFAPTALDLGFHSVRAVPLRLRGRTVGALNLFHVLPGREVGRDGADFAQPLADLAVLALLQSHHDRDRAVTEDIGSALADRTAVERAKGMLAEAGGIDMDAAFQLLRAHARDSGTGAADTARSLVGGLLSARDVLDPTG
ncbi:GAF and ANTAR domain-containing protein [Kitasatospora sp. NPDC004240]